MHYFEVKECGEDEIREKWDFCLKMNLNLFSC